MLTGVHDVKSILQQHWNGHSLYLKVCPAALVYNDTKTLAFNENQCQCYTM